MSYFSSVTQDYWDRFHEDHRLGWKGFIRIFAILIMYPIEKTGNIYFDLFVSLLIASISLLIIESQRNYNKYSVGLRKFAIRLLIKGSSILIALAGISLYCLIFVIVGFVIFEVMFKEAIANSVDEINQLLLLFVFFAAMAIATVKHLKEKQVLRYLCEYPKQFLSKVFIKQLFKAKNFYSFAIFESSVILISYLVASVTFLCAIGYVQLINI